MSSLISHFLPVLHSRRDGDECTVEPADISQDLPLRITSIFVILIGGLLGSLLPILLQHYNSKFGSQNAILRQSLFAAKFFGSGVIIGTAWMHLLAPGIEALNDPCLEELSDYSWALFISVTTVLLMFGIEMAITKLDVFNQDPHHHHEHQEHEHDHTSNGHTSRRSSSSDHGRRNSDEHVRHIDHQQPAPHGHGAHENSHHLRATETALNPKGNSLQYNSIESIFIHSEPPNRSPQASGRESPTFFPFSGSASVPGPSLTASTVDLESAVGSSTAVIDKESPRPATSSNSSHHHHDGSHHHHKPNTSTKARLVSIFILEFGVVFHSILIGLTLAVAENFAVLFSVLVFHQTFEGLGLGARLAAVPSSEYSHRSVPYLLALGFALSTPLATGLGLAMKKSLSGSKGSLLVSGVLDSVSAGILIYTGLIELLAHEFMFSEDMMKGRNRNAMVAYALVVSGTMAMCLLAKWA